jgi:heterodisulfide reductase subunit C
MATEAVIERKTIKTAEADQDFINRIIEAGAEHLKACIQCGTCTASCPSGRRTAYRTRQIIRSALLGLKDELLSDPNIWLCTTCYTCYERCPRKIETVNSIVEIRNMAVEAGHMLPAHKATCQKLIEFGHAVPIDDPKWGVLRKSLGLPEKPPTVTSFDDALKQVQKIVKLTNFDRLVGYAWK